MRFLADASCDFGVVRALRTVGHDVSAIVEVNPGAEDEAVLALARSEARVLLTEDKGFGQIAFSGGQQTAGVVLIRFPAGVRSALGQATVDVRQRTRQSHHGRVRSRPARARPRVATESRRPGAKVD